MSQCTISAPWVIEHRRYHGAQLFVTPIRALYTRAVAERRAASLTSSHGPRSVYIARPADAAEAAIFPADTRYSLTVETQP